MVTEGSFSFLPLLSPSAWLLLLPHMAERFLSDKREMWGMGFHYSIFAVAVCAYGSIRGLVLLRGVVDKVAAAVPEAGVDQGVVEQTLGLGVALSVFFVAAFASPIGVELATLEKPYFASRSEAARYQRALAVVPDDAAVVAQNHFLPHVAMREHIWLPEERFVEKADVVVLDPVASPWPKTTDDIKRLTKRLLDDTRFHLVFSEETTVVFSRLAGASVAPSAALLAAVKDPL
jgi:uncharacterized membrane protein